MKEKPWIVDCKLNVNLRHDDVTEKGNKGDVRLLKEGDIRSLLFCMGQIF